MDERWMRDGSEMDQRWMRSDERWMRGVSEVRMSVVLLNNSRWWSFTEADK